eukprot:2026027-Rhodomonas_salina.1
MTCAHLNLSWVTGMHVHGVLPFQVRIGLSPGPTVSPRQAIHWQTQTQPRFGLHSELDQAHAGWVGHPQRSFKFSQVQNEALEFKLEDSRQSPSRFQAGVFSDGSNRRNGPGTANDIGIRGSDRLRAVTCKVLFETPLWEILPRGKPEPQTQSPSPNSSPNQGR